MLLPLVLSLTVGVSGGQPYSGPPPEDQFWKTIASHAGLQPLRGHRSLRLIRVAWALYPATIVTVVPTVDGAQVEITVLPNWQKPGGASVRTRKLSAARYEVLRELAKTGLWAQPPVGVTGSPGVTDGVVWYIEGFREGETYSIVRHEPNEPHIRALCAEFMSIIGESDQAPRVEGAGEQ